MRQMFVTKELFKISVFLLSVTKKNYNTPIIFFTHFIGFTLFISK